MGDERGERRDDGGLVRERRQRRLVAGATRSGGFNAAGDQYLTLGSASQLRSATFTVELWFQRTAAGTPTSTGTGGVTNAVPLITKGRAEAETAAADVNYFLGIDATTNKLVADFEEGQSGSTPSANHPITGTTAIAIGSTWHHAAATYDGTTWNLYLDGALDGTLAVNKPANASTNVPTTVGSALTTGGVAAGFFGGTVDEVRIWDVARTGPQIAGSKDSEITGSQANLLGRWGMNEGSGSSAADSAGSGYNGTLIGSPAWVSGFPIVIANDAPVCAGVPLTTAEDTAGDAAPSCTDGDGDPLTYAIAGAAQPRHGLDRRRRSCTTCRPPTITVPTASPTRPTTGRSTRARRP